MGWVFPSFVKLFIRYFFGFLGFFGIGFFGFEILGGSLSFDFVLNEKINFYYSLNQNSQ